MRCYSSLIQLAAVNDMEDNNKETNKETARLARKRSVRKGNQTITFYNRTVSTKDPLMGKTHYSCVERESIILFKGRMSKKAESHKKQRIG